MIENVYSIVYDIVNRVEMCEILLLGGCVWMISANDILLVSGDETGVEGVVYVYEE